MNDYFARLEQRIDELEDFVLELDDRVNNANLALWVSVAGVAVTLVVGLLQAAATWYK